ncbi:hypothetical protein N836_28920 [Leptolyngbya sp. Heron Island J]|uniref:FHA domain-containing protein n=1 Tax=Leptolyngbya sp. Heron Island J TaxID=1385935 RepID=UPI0003B9B558|nr:FHA domain-containing protein [Leptolyngbya sp. Heron Island J]ESA39101.1 hypothetical protein N836_28920 [Leptolyngbya sp. Heron Island J]
MGGIEFLKMPKPFDYLLITEITTKRQHQIPLSRIREDALTIGRSSLGSNHLQIGLGTDAYSWISKQHCTLFALPRENAPGKWDYYIQDGHQESGHWIPSQQGIWVGGRQQPADLPIQLRPGPGQIEIFPKLAGLKYRCILEWPTEPEPGDDTDRDPPTLQQYEAVLMEKRVFQEQAEHNRQQLERLGRNMAHMQATFTDEREELSGKINQQSDLLLQLSTTLEQERQLNKQQQDELTAQRRRNLRVKIAIATLGLIVCAIGVLALNVDQETLRGVLEWSLLIVGGVGGVLGVSMKGD